MSIKLTLKTLAVLALVAASTLAIVLNGQLATAPGFAASQHASAN
ncbi:MAG: hypothetical protein V4724_24135 [Pseudomonadota bacterium]